MNLEENDRRTKTSDVEKFEAALLKTLIVAVDES
jgi:hypothetical protein